MRSKMHKFTTSSDPKAPRRRMNASLPAPDESRSWRRLPEQGAEANTSDVATIRTSFSLLPLIDRTVTAFERMNSWGGYKQIKIRIAPEVPRVVLGNENVVGYMIQILLKSLFIGGGRGPFDFNVDVDQTEGAADRIRFAIDLSGPATPQKGQLVEEFAVLRSLAIDFCENDPEVAFCRKFAEHMGGNFWVAEAMDGPVNFFSVILPAGR